MSAEEEVVHYEQSDAKPASRSQSRQSSSSQQQVAAAESTTHSVVHSRQSSQSKINISPSQVTHEETLETTHSQSVHSIRSGRNSSAAANNNNEPQSDTDKEIENLIKAALGAQSSGTEPKVINIISIGRSKPSKRDAKRLLSSLGINPSAADDQNASQEEAPAPAQEEPAPAENKEEEPAAAENKEEEQAAPEEAQEEAPAAEEEQHQEEQAEEEQPQEGEHHDDEQQEEQHDEEPQQPQSGRQSSARDQNKSSTSLHSQHVLDQSQSSQSLAGRQSLAASSHRGDQTLKSTTSIVSQLQGNPSQSSASLSRKSTADAAPSVANVILLSPSVVSEKKPVDDGAFDPDQYLNEINSRPPCPPPLPVPPRPASTRSILAPAATASVATVASAADNHGSTAFKVADDDDEPEQSAGSTAFRAASQSLRDPSSTSHNADAGKTPRASTVGFNLSTAAAEPDEQSTRSRTTSKASRVATPAKPVYVLTKVSRYIRKEITTEITCECK